MRAAASVARAASFSEVLAGRSYRVRSDAAWASISAAAAASVVTVIRAVPSRARQSSPISPVVSASRRSSLNRSRCGVDVAGAQVAVRESRQCQAGGQPDAETLETGACIVEERSRSGIVAVLRCEQRFGVDAEDAAGVVPDLIGDGSGAGEAGRCFVEPAEGQVGEPEVRGRPLHGVVDSGGGGDLDRFGEDRDGVCVGAEPLNAVPVVVQHAGQSPSVLERPEQTDGLGRRLPRGGLGPALELDLHPHERHHRAPPRIPQGGELAVGLIQQRRSVDPRVGAHPLHGQQEARQRGPRPITRGLEDAQAVLGRRRALLAGVHDARARALDQGDGLHGPRPGVRRAAGQRHHAPKDLSTLEVASQMPVQAQRTGQVQCRVRLPVGRRQPGQRRPQIRVFLPEDLRPRPPEIARADRSPHARRARR